MKRMINVARMLILIAEMDSAGRITQGQYPAWWCLATPRPPFIEQL